MSDSSDNNLGGGEDSDSDQDLFDDSRRQQNRKRAREAAIYGVFYDDDNHDSYDRRGEGGGGRRNRRNDGAMNIAPQFVKGKPKKDPDKEKEKEDDGEEEDDDDDDMFRSKNDSEKEISFQRAQEEKVEEEETEEEKAQAEEERKKQEAANDYFLSLLKRGKGEKDRRKPTSSSYQNLRSDISTSAAGAMGLGFRTGGGLGFTVEPTHQSGKDTDGKSAPPSFAPATAGLGMQSSAQGLGMPSAFGAGNAFEEETKPAFVKDPNLGAWEKHTKGFGLKMLAKMGYKGSGGLGSTRRKTKTMTDEKTGEKVEVEAPAKKGISRPVEVVVRPNNLGLGYGNFKEATKLKNNQQIEAEVRGIDLKKKQQEKEKEAKAKEASLQTSTRPKGESSALPSVQDLMQQKAWKRGAKLKSQKSRKRPRRTVIPYTELLEQHSSSQSSVIIDMRGPATTVPDATDDKGQPKEVPLAEELLHNLSLLLNTYENRVHSNSHFVRSTQQKVQSFQSDISGMEQRRKENRNRVQKLKKVLETLDRIEAIVNKSASSNGDSSSNDTSDIATVQSLVRELQESFTPDERAKLRFFDVLAPSLLEPVIQTRLENWDPLKNDVKSNNKTMEAVISFWKDYPTADAQDSESAYVMARAIFTNLLLPRVKTTLESQRWDPIHDVEIGLQLYEGLCRVADAASPPSTIKAIQPRDDNDQILPTEHDDDDDDATEKGQQLKNFVKEEIIHKTIYFKLTRALSQWKPTLDDSGEGLMDRPSLWILPWLPHLDHRSILPTLMADCKRKLRTAVSYLQKNVDSDDGFCRATLQTVRPWCKVYPKETLQALASTSVMLRIASAVAMASSSAFRQPMGGTNTNGSSGCPAIEWNVVEGAMEMHSSHLLADKEFLSIIEGELLSRWASRMHGWLTQEMSHWQEAVEVYLEWRHRLFEGEDDITTTTTTTHLVTSRQCLKHDRMVCAVFYSVLLMIQAANHSDKTQLDDLKPTATNARAVLARRTREEREKAQEELYRMEATGVASGTSSGQDPASVEARVRAAQRHQGHTPTFREVVEEFARDNDVLFQPRMGNNATKDGKQVFLFGEIPVYLDSDVVFAYQSSEWRPTSLTQLGLMQKARN